MSTMESDSRPTGVHIKREAKLLSVIGLTIKYADCHIAFFIISSISKTHDFFLNLYRKISPGFHFFLKIYTLSYHKKALLQKNLTLHLETILQCR